MLYVTLEKRIQRQNPDAKKCRDCYPAKNVLPKTLQPRHKLNGNCLIHKGELELHTMLPIDKDGKPILRGYRICGLMECVNPDHITTDKKKAKRWLGEDIPNLVKGNYDLDPAEVYALAKPQPPGTNNGCAVPDCLRPHGSAGLCHRHKSVMARYAQANNLPLPGRWRAPNYEVIMRPRKEGHFLTTSERRCLVENCQKEHHARGLCNYHHLQHMRQKHGRKS